VGDVHGEKASAPVVIEQAKATPGSASENVNSGLLFFVGLPGALSMVGTGGGT